MKTLEFVKNEAVKMVLKRYPHLEVKSFSIISWGDNIECFWNKPTLEFAFENSKIEVYHKGIEEPLTTHLGIQFTCSYKTPKGYISSKKLPIEIKNVNSVTLEEAAKLLKFNTDAKKNTFDPFYAENQAKRRNAIGWATVALNHLQDDCR